MAVTRYPPTAVGYAAAVAAVGVDAVRFAGGFFEALTGPDWTPVRGESKNPETVYRWAHAPIPVTALGAVGDGVTNSLAAFNEAARVASEQGRPMSIPDGRYRLEAEFVPPSGLTIQGTGTIVGNSSAAPNSNVIRLTGSNQTLRGFAIDQAYMYSGRSVLVDGAQNATIDGLRSSNTQSAFVEIKNGAAGTIVTNCRHRGVGYGVISSDSGLGAITVTDNVFLFDGSGLGDGVEINNPTTGSKDVTISGNRIVGYRGVLSDAGIGIGLAKCKGGLVIGNTVIGCEADGIHVEDQSTGVLVMGNRVINSATHLAASAGILLLYTDHSTVSFNIVIGCTGGHGVMVSGFGNDQYVHDCVVQSNQIIDSWEAGIFLNTTRRAKVFGNVVKNSNTGNNAGYGHIDLRRIGAATKQNLRAQIMHNTAIDGVISTPGLRVEAGDTGKAMFNDFSECATAISGAGAGFSLANND